MKTVVFNGLSLLAWDRLAGEGFDWLIGVDEVGRGALAGEVMAGAVAIPVAFLHSSGCSEWEAQVNDSKKITSVQRSHIAAVVREWSGEGLVCSAVASADVGEIEQLNILGATQLAMCRALELLFAAGVPEVGNGSRLLIDGRPMKNVPWPHEGVIKGDGTSFAIALAANLAKVTRDAHMTVLSREHSNYNWQQNKGYGTRDHVAAIRTHGPCELHRALFLRKCLTS